MGGREMNDVQIAQKMNKSKAFRLQALLHVSEIVIESFSNSSTLHTRS